MVTTAKAQLPKVVYGGGLAYFVAKSQDQAIQVHASKLKITSKKDQKAVYTNGPFPSLVVDGKWEIELEFDDMLVHELPYKRQLEQMADNHDLTISVWAYSESQAQFVEAMRFYGCSSVDIDTEFTINEPSSQKWKLKAHHGFEVLAPQLIEESPAFQT